MLKKIFNIGPRWINEIHHSSENVLDVKHLMDEV
jgi:hypothetical protein